MARWNGIERRKKSNDGLEGRRLGDVHCGEHNILWKHHDDDKTDHRKVVCGKIARVEREVERLEEEHAKDIKAISSSATPWKVFALSMMILVALFGWIGQEIKSGNSEIKASVNTLHRRISDKDTEMSSETNGLKDAINKVNSSIQSLETRIKEVEKAVDAKTTLRRTP